MKEGERGREGEEGETRGQEDRESMKLPAIRKEKHKQTFGYFTQTAGRVTRLTACLCLLSPCACLALCPCPLVSLSRPLALPLSPSPPPASPEPSDDVTVTGEGMAAFTGDVVAAQEEAVWEAKRNAVEQAVGIFLKARTLGAGFGVEEDELQARTQGFVRKWEVIEGSRRIETVTTGGKTVRILHIRVQATVGLLPLAQRLADIADVYKDLERPRIRVVITAQVKRGKPAIAKTDEARREETTNAALRLQNQLAGALRAQGFDVADEGAAEVVLTGTLDMIPTVHIGDTSTPYGVGDMVAACRARLTLQAISTSGEDVLFVRRAEAAGRSFQNDADAADDAVTRLSQDVLGDSANRFVPELLARWARERQEGHVIVVRVEGLDGPGRDRLKGMLADMRGFRHWVDEQQDAKHVTLRFLTRRDTRSVRRDLAAFALAPPHSISGPSSPGWQAGKGSTRAVSPATPSAATALLVLNDRGPLIECAARAGASSRHER